MRSVSMSYYFIIFTSCRFNSFYLWFWFLSLLSFVWIGGQFPQDNFLSSTYKLSLRYILWLDFHSCSYLICLLSLLFWYSICIGNIFNLWMHFLGFNVMPRRIPSFPDTFHSLGLNWKHINSLSISSTNTFWFLFFLTSR